MKVITQQYCSFLGGHFDNYTIKEVGPTPWSRLPTKCVTINHKWVINRISWTIGNSYTLRHRGGISDVLIIWFLIRDISPEYGRHMKFLMTTTTTSQKTSSLLWCCHDNFTNRPPSDWSAPLILSSYWSRLWLVTKDRVPWEQPSVTRAANYCVQ